MKAKKSESQAGEKSWGKKVFMALFSAGTGSSILLAQLVAAAVRTTVLAAGAGLLLSLFRLKATSARLFVWTAVLYAGLSMPILSWLLHPIAVPLLRIPTAAKSDLTNPATFASVEIPNSDQFANSKGAARSVAITPSAEIAIWHSLHTERSRASSWIQWTTLTAAAYLAITVFLLLRIVAGGTFARRLVRSSNPIQDSRILLRLRSRAHAPHSWFVPRVCESSLLSVPVTIGVIAPTILLPSTWHEWDDAKLDSVIIHEISHVTRRDALSQYVSLLYRAIFWFSPLAWWLNRHITELAEEASDEAALAAGAERTGYARTLLGFLQAVKDSPGRIQWQGVSIANADQAEKRLEKILAWTGGYPMRLKRSAIAVMIAFAIPAIYMTAAARPISHGQSSQDATSTRGQASPPPTGTPTEPRAPASAPGAPSIPPAPADGGVSNSGPAPAQPSDPVVAPPMPAAPAPPVSPVASQAEDSAKSYESGFSYAYGFGDEQRFVIVSGNSDRFTMSGTSEDARHAERLKKRIPGDFIWFQRDEKSYIIHDQATVDRARQLWAPQEELGRKQAELGKQQEALGKQQQELGARMQQVRVKVPDMTAELDKLKAELQQLGPDASMEQIGKIQARIGELQARFGELQAHAGDDQGKLGTEMGALGEQQGKLGEQQGELGRQQAELAQKASRAMKQLLDDAIRKGLAQPEPQEPGSASL